MTGNVPFLMKDVVLLAVSLYLLRQDVVRLTRQWGDTLPMAMRRRRASRPPAIARSSNPGGGGERAQGVS
jgi:hypothetical protein